MTDPLDAGLDELAATGPSYWGGLANHGPMVVETLDFLGVSDAIEPWIGWYATRLEPVAKAAPAYLELNASARGDLDTLGWEAVLRQRLPRLVTDCAAGSAGHGLLRAAHAVRALSKDDTPVRRTELAAGLAYWEWTFSHLPGPPPTPRGGSHAAEVLGDLPKPDVATGGFFTTVLPAVAVTPGFAEAVDALAPPTDVEAALADVTEAAAHAYLANSRNSAIALVHAVTIPSALRVLLRFLSSDSQRVAFAYAWQTVAAMVAGFGDGLVESSTEVPAWSDIVTDVVAARDDHAIKLAGACQVEHHLNPSPVFLHAAADGAVQLDASETTS